MKRRVGGFPHVTMARLANLTRAVGGSKDFGQRMRIQATLLRIFHEAIKERDGIEVHAAKAA